MAILPGIWELRLAGRLLGLENSPVGRPLDDCRSCCGRVGGHVLLTAPPALVGLLFGRLRFLPGCTDDSLLGNIMALVRAVPGQG